MITVDNVTKTFKQPVTEPGLKGAIKHLFKGTYHSKNVIDNISLKIHSGDTVAFLGKNGAGKSTMIKMLTGILLPSKGSININGKDPFRDRMEICKNIGAVFGQRTQLWWDVPVIESLKLMRDIYEVDNSTFTKNMNIFHDLLDLAPFLHSTPRRLSLGQRMRADLAMAFIHDPAIIYLDEPTIGLDVQAKDKIRKFIKHVNEKQKTTVLLTTHDLGDIDNICEKLILIDEGAIIFDGYLNDFKKNYVSTRKIFFTTDDPNLDLTSIANRISGVNIDYHQGREFALTFNGFKLTAGEVVAMVMNYCKVLDIRIQEASLEEVIKKVYMKEINIQSSELLGANYEKTN